MTKLTASNIPALPPGDHTDAAVTGLQLRVRKGKRKTSRTWLFRFKWQGEEPRLPLGTFPAMSLADARAAALTMRALLDKQIDPRRAQARRRGQFLLKGTPAAASPAAKPHDRHSIEFLCAEFMELHIDPTRKRPEAVRAVLNKEVLQKEGWAGRDARTIKPREVIELLDKIVSRGSKVQANRVAALLTQLFKFGIHRGIVDTSPVMLLYRPGGKEKPRERALSDKELAAFLKAEDLTKTDRLRHALNILLFTGQRRGELAAAKWEHIDLRHKTWVIPDENTKTGKGHAVPLSALAVAEFKALHALAGKSAYVWPDESGKGPADPKLITRGLARCLKRFKAVGIEAFTAHDLRRTCRTGLARLKVVPHVAERVLNHAQEKIPGTYDVHDYLDEKREALDSWGAYLEGLRA